MHAEDAIRVAKRRPLVAVLLSFLSAGLGQVYCGRIARGLLLMLLSGGLGPLLAVLVLIAPFRWSTAAVLAAFALPSLVWLYATIEAFILAIRTGHDYRLKDYNRWYVYLLLLLTFVPTSVAYALIVRDGFYQAFSMASASMRPTLQKRDRVLVDKRIYRTQPLQRGDVVTFINPNQRHARFIKRVVALPDDTIEMHGGELYVNGEKLPRTESSHPLPDDLATSGDSAKICWEMNGAAKYQILLAPPDTNAPRQIREIAETTIPPGHCYVLGDNRNNCRDSRHFGPVPLVDLVGRVQCVYYPRREAVHR
jgi:signal peptidase I